MKINKTTNISLRVVFLFSLAIVLSFIPEHLHSCFGDEYCNGLITNIETGKIEYYFHYGGTHQNWEWHWGYRHWLFLMMGISLSIIQIVNIVKIIEGK